MKALLLREFSVAAPPDGGLLAWLQVFAGFLVYFVCVGLQYGLGVLVSALLQDVAFLSGATRAEVSWVSSVEASFFLFGSLPAAYLFPYLGVRGTIVLGGALLAFGSLLAASSASLSVVTLSMALFGLGCSFPSTVVLTCLQGWFSKRRGFASGLVVCGSGFGGMVLGPLLQAQVDAGGWRQAFQFVGLLATVVIPVGALLTIPLSLGQPPPPPGAASAPAPIIAAEAGGAPPPPPPPAAAAALAVATPTSAVDEEVAASRRLERHFVDWPEPSDDPPSPPSSPPLSVLTLLSIQPFQCFLIFIGLYGGAWFSLIAHYNSACREQGTSPDDAALLVTWQGIMNIAGRLSMGYTADVLTQRGLSKVVLLQFNLSVMALFTLALAEPRVLASRPFQVVYAIINGFFGGSIPSLQGPLLIDIVGLPYLPLSFGLLHAVQAPMVLVSPVASGALRAATGNWMAVWLLNGLAVTVGPIVLSFMMGLPSSAAPLTVSGVLKRVWEGGGRGVQLA
jgi:MFS family permease